MPDGIDTPSDDFYNINTSNYFNMNPQVKCLIPMTPQGKQKPSKVASDKCTPSSPKLLLHFGDLA